MWTMRDTREGIGVGNQRRLRFNGQTRSESPFNDPGDSPGWEKFLPRRVMLGTGFRIGSTHFVVLEIQLDDTKWIMDTPSGSLQRGT